MTGTCKTTTVSAPGKILLAGGYVVLEAPNVGVVLAVDKRFYSTVVRDIKEERSSKKSKTDISEASDAIITVQSPQFGSTWKYSANITAADGSLELTADPNNETTNAFVEKTLRITLAYCLCAQNDIPNNKLTHLEITILADNDFYSVAPHLQERNWEATPENLARLPKFLPCSTTSRGTLQKTGLGSSAALVTSLVGALVVNFTGNNNPTESLDDTTKRRIHNLAQICHCHAQGKVGSGFDVSSASYGSHVYQRFPKTLLSGLLQELETTQGNTISKGMAQSLRKLVEESTEEYKWTGGVVKPLSWNTDLLQIMLADVSGGSESPSMARKILEWKASSNDISCWNNLLKYNDQVVEITDKISETLKGTDPNNISKIAEDVGTVKFEEYTRESGPEIVSYLCDLRSTLVETRKNLKRMGDLAGVPVEPDEQSALADATMTLPGVVASLVPGAGGYDALVVVYVNTSTVRDNICNLWTNYKELEVCPLAVKFGEFGEGVRCESVIPGHNKQED